jgi:glycosyltransferase involved in cell wall biosynthesis
MMPDLSVVIPTHNGAERLRKCLESLIRQTLPPNSFETIVVVDGSTDHTARMLEDLNPPFRLVVIQQNNQGAGAARNTGVAAARGTYCVFLDDDIIADPELLAEHLRVQRAEEGVVGLGAIPTVVPSHTGWLVRCFVEYSNEHCVRLASGGRPTYWRDCYSGNMSVARAAFSSVGGFATDMPRGEDVELGYRLSEQGLSFVYIPGALGTEMQRKDPRQLVADFEENAVAATEIYRRHPRTLPDVIPDFSWQGAESVWLRRLLLATGIPPRVLVAVGPLAGKENRIRAWYGFIHSYCYWRGVRRGLADPQSWWQLTHSTPILSYRALGIPGQPGERHLVPIRRFARQMAWLKGQGYRLLSLEQYLQYQREYRLPPKRSIVIAIDESHGSTDSLADPVLRRYGYPAAAFLVSTKGAAGNDPEGGRGRRGLRPSGVNNHRTPAQELHRTEIHGTDSLLRFAWKVSRASSGTPRPRTPALLLRAVRRRVPQVTR